MVRIFLFLVGLVAAGIAVAVLLEVVPFEAAQEMVVRGAGVVGVVFLVALLGAVLFKGDK